MKRDASSVVQDGVDGHDVGAGPVGHALGPLVLEPGISFLWAAYQMLTVL